MLRSALLVAAKDLQIERRSKVTTTQVAPFAILVLVLFAFALGDAVINDPGRSRVLPPGTVAGSTLAAGLFWLAVFFSALVSIQRSFALEIADGGRDGLRMSALDPAGIFLGKAAAILIQLLLLEALLAVGIVLFFDASFADLPLFVVTAVLATIGLVAVGTCHGALSAGLRVRDTLLPLLYFPVVAPVMVASVRATESSLNANVGGGWGWVRLLVGFAVMYVALGIVTFGSLMEET